MIEKHAAFVQVSRELLDDYPQFDIEAFLNRPASDRAPLPPPPTVDDLYDEWSDNHGADGVNDWRDFLISTIGDEGWQALAYEAARAAFKAGYEAGQWSVDV